MGNDSDKCLGKRTLHGALTVRDWHSIESLLWFCFVVVVVVCLLVPSCESKRNILAATGLI